MKEFICIVCPRGCHLQVDDNLNVTGNSCPRGEAYGKSEATLPVRTITTTVRIISKTDTVVPVKTSSNFDKSKIFDLIDEIKKIEVKAPIRIGDVIAKNILGLGIDLVATKNVLE